VLHFPGDALETILVAAPGADLSIFFGK